MALTEQNLINLHKNWSGKTIKNIEPLQAHGSDRTYFRLFDEDGYSILGAHNADKRENIAFIGLSRVFKAQDIPVPEIYAEDLDQNIYLQEDLGNITLFDYLTHERQKNGFSDAIVKIYEKVLRQLPKIQIAAAPHIDFDICYPRKSFDKQSMLWDLNYFKYYFLKLAKIPFDEQHLENDFHTFIDFLLNTDRDFFLYRDFQSRNIMLVDDTPHFIDFQGGRRGALQYDIASLLFDAKADIPQTVREHLLNYYLDASVEYHKIDRSTFMQFYYGYVFIRIMQALGAYGFRGFYERKTHFLKSVPYAIKNLEWLLQTAELPIEIPTLTDAWLKLVRSSFLRTLGDAQLRLHIRLQSFSFKRGIPADETGHGGGFVFDCRALPNPGRYEQYKTITGNDAPVIEFLQKEPVVEQFVQNAALLVENSIRNYQERNFTDLMISFGCTGGQHRSVYCTNRLAEVLQEKFEDIDITVRHREQEIKKKK